LHKKKARSLSTFFFFFFLIFVAIPIIEFLFFVFKKCFNFKTFLSYLDIEIWS
jgi:hypothetical protein